MDSLDEISRYRKVPVEIEAIQYTGVNVSAVDRFTQGQAKWDKFGVLFIPTLEGTHVAMPGDYIIKGVKGEFYPCKPDIFALTYVPVEQPSRRWDGERYEF